MGNWLSNTDYCNTTDLLPRGVPEQIIWMAGVPDQTSLAELSIPGTHCSHTYRTPRHQSLNIDQMLRAGIRFFDLEMRLDANVQATLWQDNRESGPEDSLRSVLAPFVYFLHNFPSETILCCITEAVASEGPGIFAEAVCRQIQEHVQGSFLWTRTYLPKMGGARGKIVFLRNFPDCRERCFPFGSVVTSNRNGLSARNDVFWEAVRRDLQRAELGEPCHLHVTYTSHKALWSKNAHDLNRRLFEFVQEKAGARLGVVVIDFPGSLLISAIIETNRLEAIEDVAVFTDLDSK